MSEKDLIQLVASAERTPQLSQYWSKRYSKFLAEKLFVISDKTKGLLVEDDVNPNPTTPFGHIDLLRFVSKNRTLEEVALQNSVETAVRFLDSCIDVINFGQGAATTVAEFRKVGLGVIGFEEYMIAKNATSKDDEINYLGNIISASAYRASEALAEEKGVCGKWNQIKTMIRPKSFEYWYDTETGDIENGLEVMEKYDQTTIEQSRMEIIPRRNSNIMLYPVDSQWVVWSDRDEVPNLDKQEQITTPEKVATSIEELEQNKAKRVTLEEVKQTLNQSFSDLPNEVRIVNGLQTTKKMSKIGGALNAGKKVVHQWFSGDKDQDQIMAQGLNSTETKNPFIESFENQKVEILDQTDATKLQVPKPTKTVEEFKNEPKPKLFDVPLTNFIINDVVKIINKKSNLNGSIFQIQELEYDLGSNTYQATLDEKKSIVVRESEIVKLSLDQLLEESKILPSITSISVIVDQNANQIALLKDSYLVPQITKCNPKENLQKQILNELKKTYKLTPAFCELSGIKVSQNQILVSFLISLSIDDLDLKLKWSQSSEVLDKENLELVELSLIKAQNINDLVTTTSQTLAKEAIRVQALQEAQDYSKELDQVKAKLALDYNKELELVKSNLVLDFKSQFDSQVKDLTYKIHEKNKEISDIEEGFREANSHTIKGLELEIQGLNKQIQNLQKQNELEKAVQRDQLDKEYNQKLDTYQSQIDELNSTIKENSKELIQFEKNLEIQKNELFANAKSDHEIAISRLSQEIQSNLDVNKELKSTIDKSKINYQTKESELKANFDTKMVQIQAMIDDKHNEYVANLDEVRKGYEDQIQILQHQLVSKDNQIDDVKFEKQKNIEEVLQEQSRVRLDLEQMCLARIEQQKKSQATYESIIEKKYQDENLNVIEEYTNKLKAEQDNFHSTLSQKDDFLADVISQKEKEFKLNLSRQQQHYERLIRSMAIQAPVPDSQSFEIKNEVEAKKLKNKEAAKEFEKVEASVIEPTKIVSASSIDHSSDEIFHKTRENLFKPNLPQFIPITTVHEADEIVINHSTSLKNITTKEDTLNTLLKMKSIVARK